MRLPFITANAAVAHHSDNISQCARVAFFSPENSNNEHPTFSLGRIFCCGAFYRASVRIVDADPFSPPGGWEPTRRLRMANARRAGNWKRDIFRVYIRTCETCAKRVKNTDLPYAAQIRRIVRACGGVCVQIARTHKHRVIESTSILFVRSTQRRGAATERHGDVGQNDKTEF